ncbi:MAG: reverse transcriptase domain-containing protein [Candidatus Nomurabacteria bacterium]|nr:reverse transcriptase domain-containing protein [Candidatus Nomurabacteria bacterium]
MSTIFTLEKLYKAYKECQKGKKNTINALCFEVEREKNLILLLNELQSGTYEISRSVYFIVTNPTAREIFAADFRDRIVHHLLCNEIQNIFEADFISDSYANRKRKGTHKAVAQLQKYTREAKSKTKNGYYLKLDVESFFCSINREILYSIVEKKIRDCSQPVGGGLRRK